MTTSDSAGTRPKRIEDLPVSRRTISALLNSGLTEVDELVQLAIPELHRIRLLGQSGIEEIADAVKSYGLALGIVASSTSIQIFERGHPPDSRGACSLEREELPPRLRLRLLESGIQCSCELAALNAPQLLRIFDFNPSATRCVADSVRASVVRTPSIGAHLDQSLNFPLDRISLSPRSRNGLRKAGITRVGDLILLTDDERRRIRNLGQKSWSEIDQALQQLTLGLAEEATDSSEPEHRRNPVPDPIDLSDELWRLTAAAGLESNRRRVAAYYGFDGSGDTTMQEIAVRFGGSRQWVAQLCAKVEADATKELLSPVFVPAAVQLVEANAPCAVETVPSLIRDHGLATTGVTWRGLSNAARLLHIETGLVLLEESGLLVPENQRPLVENAFSLTRKTISALGATNIDEVASLLDGSEGTAETSVLRTVLPHMRGFRWLDEESGWFWLGDSGVNRLSNQIKKVLAVSTEIPIQDLRRAVLRHHGLAEAPITISVLRQLCMQLPSTCRVAADVIVRGDDLSEDVLSDSERKYVRVLTQHGPVLSREDIERLLPDVSQPTIAALLAYSPVVKRFSYMAYGLVGANPGKAAVSRPPQRKDRVIIDHGWTPEGKLWIAYCASRSMISQGIFSIPGALRDLLTGDFSLVDSGGEPFGTIRIGDGSSGWGLGKFFRRRGGEPDDVVLLQFDLPARYVIVQVGSDENVVSLLSSASSESTPGSG